MVGHEKSKRKSPSDSATLFKVGTKKKGNDGRMWIIVSYNGIHRWVPLEQSINESTLQVKNDIIKIFDFDMIMKKFRGTPKKLGKLRLTHNKIGIGELIFSIYPAKKGIYSIYNYHYCLIAVPENYSLAGQIFKSVKGDALCDIGMFAYNDPTRVPYIKRKTLWFPFFDTGIFLPPSSNRIKDDAYYLYESDLLDKSEETDEEPIALFAENGFGDGSFPIFKSQYAYMIMSQKMYDMIIDLYQRQSDE